MKRRINELVAIKCTDVDSGISLRPFVLPGGENAEYNRLMMIENFQRIYGGIWLARIVYRWRSKNHLMRWVHRGEKWRS